MARVGNDRVNKGASNPDVIGHAWLVNQTKGPFLASARSAELADTQGNREVAPGPITTQGAVPRGPFRLAMAGRYLTDYLPVL